MQVSSHFTLEKSQQMHCVAIFSFMISTDDEDDRDENLGLSEANVDSAGEGIGVCRTTPWTNWSPCSASCGIGISMRTRTFIDHSGRKKCPHISIGNFRTINVKTTTTIYSVSATFGYFQSKKINACNQSVQQMTLKFRIPSVQSHSGVIGLHAVKLAVRV